MTDLDVQRTVRFVSLDTHPANSALVVTYEILVVVNDSQRGRELMRRTKRDQMQVVISTLDNLKGVDHEKEATLDLHQLSQEIIRKCPILSQQDESQALEDIQLHLLYLLNRRRSQLYQASAGISRPPSAASDRLKSAGPVGSRSRLMSARQGSARQLDGRRSANSSRSEASSSLDIYASFCEKELRNNRIHGLNSELDSDRLNDFLAHFRQHLADAEANMQINANFSQNNHIDSEAQLEGLYGDIQEKIAAISNIKWHAQDDLRLASMQPSRLLISAMLRTLQDSDAKHALLSESILYCLVRFTQFEDVNTRVFDQGDPIDLMRVVVDLLEEHLELATKADDLRSILDKFYNLSSLLVIVNNTINLDLHIKSNKMKQKLIQHHGKRLANILIGMFVLISRHLPRDVRSQSGAKYERLTLILAEIISLCQSLTIFREFVNLLRANSQTLVDSLITCLDTLQLCRPGSGSTQPAASAGNERQQSADSKQDFLIKDQLILCEIYGLEIELLKLINNLIYDSRFKLRFSRKNLLLKSVLRNLVVFLASSRRSNTLTPYDRSSVLLVPFKCLYELSCQDLVKEELFKSKIITKCLLEYLLSATADYKTLLDSLSPASRDKLTVETTKEILMDYDQITLDPNHATHYIVATWLNLSAKKSAPFFNRNIDRELSEPLCDYIELALLNQSTYVAKRKSHSTVRVSQNTQLIVYIHAKLLRNFTQHLSFFEQAPAVWANNYKQWLELLSQSVHDLLPYTLAATHTSDQIACPLAVECVAIMSNLMLKSGNFWHIDDETSTVPMLDWPLELKSILKQLFTVSLLPESNAEGENDDLLLVSIILLGNLARCREICNEITGIVPELIKTINFILDTKGTDIEMIVCCLFTLGQLLNHWVLSQALCASLEDEQHEAVMLVDKLSLLMMHGDLSVSRLTTSILNMMKQFEEQQSLNDSITGGRRFDCYNEKWLNAIKANRDEPRDYDEQVDVNDDFNQIRTMGNEDSSSTTPSSRHDELDSVANGDDLGDEVVDDEDDEEETFSEPDLNVIDANSMIKHLTNRREFRSELMLRK